MTTAPKRRVLLKISGESLVGEEGYGISPDVLGRIAEEIADTVKSTGVELALVVGGGNIFRGVSSSARGMDRASADYMGMLATVMNAMALQTAIEARGVPTRVQSAIEMHELAESYIRRRAVRHLEKGRLVIAAISRKSGSSGSWAAALRAMEIGAEILLKATRVDGVYDKDPRKHTDAVKYDRVSYLECIQKDLKVMDMTAFALCRDNRLPIMVFNLGRPGNIQRAVRGEAVGTIIGPEN